MLAGRLQVLEGLVSNLVPAQANAAQGVMCQLVSQAENVKAVLAQLTKGSRCAAQPACMQAASGTVVCVWHDTFAVCSTRVAARCVADCVGVRATALRAASCAVCWARRCWRRTLRYRCC